MRLPSWLRIRGHRPTSVGTVEVTLIADTSAYVAAMRDAASIVRYQHAVAHERSLARAYVGMQLDELARSVGLDPVEVWRLPRERDALLEDLNHPDRARRQAAEAAWLGEHRAHRAALVAQRETGADG